MLDACAALQRYLTGFNVFCPLSLLAAPYNFPQPLASASEKEVVAGYTDKMMGLWELDQIKLPGVM